VGVNPESDIVNCSIHSAPALAPPKLLRRTPSLFAFPGKGAGSSRKEFFASEFGHQNRSEADCAYAKRALA